MTAVRVGFLSTARINDLLLADARGLDDVEVVAVASRDLARAEAYAAERGIERAYGSYEALLADPGIDAVYVSLPNALHHEWTLQALEAGKHVLCEKPYSPRPDEVDEAFDAAELVFMEAFMWRHHPQTKRLAELVAEGAIGELRLIRATFSFLLTRLDDVRLDPVLDGGALMDVGCYCISGARLLAGEPDAVSGQAVTTALGVDVRFAATLDFGGEVLGHFDCAFDLPLRAELTAVGSEGQLHLADPWFAQSPGIELHRADGATERIDVTGDARYAPQWRNFAAAVRGEEPPLLGRDDALGQARVLEALYRSATEGRAVDV